MSTITTRRRAFATIAAAACIPAAAVAVPLNDRSAWMRAVARCRSTTAALASANEAHSRAEELYFGRRPDRPFFVIDMEDDYGRFGRHVLPVTIHHDDLDDPDREWADPERIQKFRQELAEYRAGDTALRHELDLDRLEDASLAAMHAQTDAVRDLIAFPAPDLAAVAEKIALILAEYDDTDGSTSAVLADVRRFAGEA